MKPKIYLIIVTYNAMKWAERCFSSLRKSSVPVHTIVVDNGSTDGTQEFIQTHFPEVDFIQSAENLGFGKANNIGIEKAYKAGADFFYLMNQDAWLFEDSIEQLLEVYDAYPNKEEIGILSPMHLDGSEKRLDIFFENYIARSNEKIRFISDSLSNNLKPFYQLYFVNAAHWFLPKKTIEEVGGFNPYFFHYSEDAEYVQRINFFKKKILICTKSLVVHDGKQDFGKTNHINVKRVHREQRYLNPEIDFSKPLFEKEFKSDIIKLFLKGKFADSYSHYKEYQYQLKRIDEIVKYRSILKNGGLAFLNL